MDLPKTNEDALIALGAKAKESSDSFIVKIERKGQYGLPESLTTCDGIELKYIIKPEEWLPTLFGGGNFILTCYHVGEPTMPIAKLVLNFRGEPQMNWTALDSGTWSGPKNFTRREPTVGTTFAEDDLGAGRRPPPYGGRSNLPPGNGEGNVRWMFEQFTKQQEKNDALLRDAIKAAAQPQKPALGVAEIATIIGGIAAPVVGLVTTMITSSAASRAEQQKERDRLQAERDRMFSEQQAARDRMLEAQQKESREMFKALATPKPTDPIVERLVNDQRKLLEKMSEGGPSESEAAMQNLALVQSMYGFMTKAISASAEAQLDKGDKGILPAFREALTAIEHIMTARMQRPALVPGQQPQLPAAHVQPVPQPAAQPGQVSLVDDVFNAIIAHEDIKKVATRVVELAETDEPSFIAAIGQYDNDIIKLAEARLGGLQDSGGLWILQPKNEFYVRSLLMEIEKSPTFGGPGEQPAPTQAAPVAPAAPAARSEASPEGDAKPAAPAPTAAMPEVVQFDAGKKSKRKLEKPSPDA